MICKKCNFQNEETAKFCRNCGEELCNAENIIPEEKKLYRQMKGKWIAGVCSGLGEYFGIYTIIVRLLFVLLWPLGLVLYLILRKRLPNAPLITEKRQSEQERTGLWLVGLILALGTLAPIFVDDFDPEIGEREKLLMALGLSLTGLASSLFSLFTEKKTKKLALGGICLSIIVIILLIVRFTY